MSTDGSVVGDIWVVTEQRDGHTKTASLALMAKARKLADERQSKVAGICLNEGVKAVLQPGGSINDYQAIEAVNEHGATMMFTGQRSFKH